MVRYADDFVMLCRSQEEAERALAWVRERVAAKGLMLHPEKTRLVDATRKGGFDFLGYHFERGMRWPRKKSLEKLKERIREETPRTSGRSDHRTGQRNPAGLVWLFQTQLENDLWPDRQLGANAAAQHPA